MASGNSLWRSILELNVAVLGDRGLLDGNHLTLDLCQFRCRLFITADQEGRGPEHDYRRRGSPFGPGTLAVLYA